MPFLPRYHSRSPSHPRNGMLLQDGGLGGSSTAATLKGIAAALNSSAEDNGPSAIQGVAATLTQYRLNGSGYNNSAVARLESSLSNLDQLTQGAQNALEDLQYNTGGGFLGTNITNDLNQTTPDYASAAYELAFGTSTPGDATYEKRALIDAAQMLGFDVTIDGNHFVSSLTATSDTKNPAIISFLQQVAVNTPSTYLSTASVRGFHGSPRALPRDARLLRSAVRGRCSHVSLFPRSQHSSGSTRRLRTAASPWAD